MPDILSVCLQDLLHRRKSDLREQEITNFHLWIGNTGDSGLKGRCFLSYKRLQVRVRLVTIKEKRKGVSNLDSSVSE